MPGRSKPIEFNPYGRRRKRRRVPGWLLLLVVGIAAGAGGVLLLQERYLPPRLSAEESTRLTASLERTDSERQRLERELAETTKRLDAALEERKPLQAEVAGSRQATQQLREDLAAVVAALPDDPRDGEVAVRAARFSAQDGMLGYDVVLTRERARDKPLTGVMQFAVAGKTGRGPETTLTLKPVPVSLGKYQVLRGSLPLPQGFDARQATLSVLDRVDGKLLGKRVLYVQ
jgi:hypothetical protein